MIGAVTPGFRSNQLSATWAGVFPVLAATACKASSTFQVCSLLYALHFSPQSFSSANFTRESSGGAVIPRRNLPESQPPRSGLQGITPNPSRIETGISSHSVLRQSRLYCGCKQTNPSQPFSRLRSITPCNSQPVNLLTPR